MFKLGSYLLFITFSQIIFVLIASNFISSIPALVYIIIILELVYSGVLIYKGIDFSKVDLEKYFKTKED